MANQHKSAFLTKLPVEIRLHIYKLVFGDKVIAFTFGGGPNIRHCLCPEKGRKFHWICWESSDSNTTWCQCDTHENPEPVARLPLLLTCWQIYFESVDTLLSHSTVPIQIMGGPYLFCILPDIKSALTPRSFNAIRSLEISFLHPYIGSSDAGQVLNDEWFSGWVGVWGVIGEMKGLPMFVYRPG
ncbi:uncharacterized protein DSM5745_06432 [Aspergillus mulundensis]|uniref:DUF7730 domain-containing protein n=1 Tax=Aspergillus mulundensis TaxID=1810919 RepID=A0A3D8RR47_9EURO|nr:hypothetical protein DSM5745_06432 [Aspergillus mulundensis]RDW76440.1 hypothetical protein DSM5745_06432 [Aspergillus mulundensis]